MSFIRKKFFFVFCAVAESTFNFEICMYLIKSIEGDMLLWYTPARSSFDVSFILPALKLSFESDNEQLSWLKQFEKSGVVTGETEEVYCHNQLCIMQFFTYFYIPIYSL